MRVPAATTDRLFAAVMKLRQELLREPGSVDEGLQVEGLLEEREGLCLYGLARRGVSLGTVVEIGSYKGKSTWFLVQGARSGGGGTVVAFDPHLEGTAEAFSANLARTGIDGDVEAHHAFSYDAVSTFTRPIGLLWIDGDHSYAGVRRDFDEWFPKLAVGGWVAFHDTVNHWRGPTRLVREILFRRNDLAEVGVMGTITFARKRPPASRNRLSALASLVAIEFVTLLRGRRMGFGPVNVASDDR